MDTIKERASVIMLRGNGEQRLKQAIMQGLVREEVAEDVDEVLRQIENVRRDYDLLNSRYQETAKQLNEFKGIYFDAIKALQRSKARRDKWKNAKSYALAVSTIFAIVLFCTIICRAIFG